ncbi:ankyrin repeat-containing domain protein [Aspergillus aurantiobrunneus]
MRLCGGTRRFSAYSSSGQRIWMGLTSIMEIRWFWKLSMTIFPVYVCYSRRRGSLEVVQLLLEHGADLGLYAQDGYKPLNEAVYGQSKECVEFLLHEHGFAGDIPAVVDALQSASLIGDVDLTRLFLSLPGLEVECQKCEFLWSPLALAVRYGNVELRVLLEHGVRTDFQAPDGEQLTPLHLAAENGGVTGLETLLSTGLDVNRRDLRGGTPLFEAAAGGYLAATQILLNSGADCNVVGFDERTALWGLRIIAMIKWLWSS